MQGGLPRSLFDSKLAANGVLRANYLRTEEVLSLRISVRNQNCRFVSVNEAFLIFSFNFRFLSASIA